MSKSLLKKSLELFDDDIIETTKDVRKKDINYSSKDAMKLIGTNRDCVKKQLKQVKRLQEQQMESRRRKKKHKTALEERQKYKGQDKTKDNLFYINQLRQLNVVSSGTVKKIIEHRRGKLSKNQKKSEVKKEEKSVFTDKDFEKFASEYVT